MHPGRPSRSAPHPAAGWERPRFHRSRVSTSPSPPPAAANPNPSAAPASGTLRLGQSVDFVWDVVVNTKDDTAQIALPLGSELGSFVLEGTWALELTCKESQLGSSSITVKVLQSKPLPADPKPWPSIAMKVEGWEGLPQWDPIQGEVHKKAGMFGGSPWGSVHALRPSGDVPKPLRITLQVGSRDLTLAAISVNEQLAALRLDGATSYTTYTSTRHPFNVRFTFPATNTEIWESSAFLQRQSPYFANLLTSEFAEGTPTASSKKRKVAEEGSTRVEKPTADSPFDDSDGEADQASAQVRDEPSCELPVYEITITSAAFSTYRAALCYLRTGYINFAPLSSTAPAPSLSNDASVKKSILSAVISLNKQPAGTAAASTTAPTSRSASPSPFSSSTPTAFCLAPKPAFDDPTQTPPLSVSPKSIYRLAHLLEHVALQSLALRELASQLRPTNVATELFGDVQRRIRRCGRWRWITV